MNFEITEIPEKSGFWKSLAQALLANIGKAAFVPSDGRTSKEIRDAANTLRRYIPMADYNLHTSASEDGVFFWLDRKAVSR